VAVRKKPPAIGPPRPFSPDSVPQERSENVTTARRPRSPGVPRGRAALFRPVPRRVQAVADRRFNRSQHDASVAVDDSAQRLRDEVDLSALRPAARRTLAVHSTVDDEVREP
jgi:hypothetical protein